MQLILRDKKLTLDHTLIMGILNVTPDSFADGGKYAETGAAVKHALDMVKDGVDIIDIGGESSRPGAAAVGEQEELKRLLPVLEAFRAQDKKTPVSIDTYRSGTAGTALSAGADMINDISGGNFDEMTMRIAAENGAAYAIMHMQGAPNNMQDKPEYSAAGVVPDIKAFFEQRIKTALDVGIKKENIVLDPGIGFGKTLDHNFEILEALGEFKKLGFPVLVGTSRKSMIGKVLNEEPKDRLFGTAATVALSIARGASIVRVHDVKEMRDVAKMTDAMINFRVTEEGKK